ncbi:tetratricopeptide repeat protein [Luteimonas deserti]|uniref:Tetratricopeptide repeat protein n=1 Tax=Luteimonas deserti TaxID=2752306 RepID=A0A7Z0TXC5_9GAMM|nr:tetratricopeptide repeat protein [Luteimonas deserti]NYZ61685.1 hypothetical protein [Luteimonas deserti]
MPVFDSVRSAALPAALFLALSGVAGAADAQRTAPAGDPLQADVLGATLAGEFAVQAGRLDEAADWYLAAARHSDGDAGLAERATRIALLAGDDRRAAQALDLWRRSAPGSLPMRAAEATLSLRSGRDRVARRQLDALLRSSDATGWRHAFTVLAGGGRNPEQAGRMLERLVADRAIPDVLQAWMAFGGLAQRLDRSDLTERILDTIVARFPGEPRVALLRASQLRESGRPDDARAALQAMGEDAALIGPDVRLAIAVEYEALGDLHQAERILAKGPQDGRTYVVRASLLARAEDKATLAALYDEVRAVAIAPNPAQRLLLGQMAEYLEQFDEALNWYDTVPGGGERLQARLRGARVLHKLERRDEAWQRLRALQSDNAADEDTRRDAYLLEAELRREDEDPAELDVYNLGLGAMPDDPAILYARALMWERRDDIARAEADLRRILVQDPENVAALNALGYTLADRTQRYTEALELIDRARLAEPDNAAIIDSYGWVLYRLGRHAEALVELRRAYSMMKDAEVAAHIAEVLWVMGRRDEARRYFDEARGLDPENRSLLRALGTTGA